MNRQTVHSAPDNYIDSHHLLSLCFGDTTVFDNEDKAVALDVQASVERLRIAIQSSPDRVLMAGGISDAGVSDRPFLSSTLVQGLLDEGVISFLSKDQYCDICLNVQFPTERFEIVERKDAIASAMKTLGFGELHSKLEKSVGSRA